MSSFNKTTTYVMLQELYEKSKNYDPITESIAEKKRKETAFQDWLRRESGVREKHYNASFDKYIAETEAQKKVLQGVKEWVKKDGGKIVVFLGNCGTGKTMLGSSAVIERRGYYTTYEWLRVRIASSKSWKATETELSILKEMVNLNFLMLDEIEKGANTRAKKQLLSFICRERYENEKPTWLAGNCNWPWLKKFLGKAVIDRCKESGVSFEFNWESYRKKNKIKE